MPKLRIECHYCPEVSPDLKTAVQHFEEKHRNNGEYVEIEVGVKTDEPKDI